jgi:GT2 family glycosyltransferase
MTLVLPEVGNPEVSVVMVTHGSWQLVEQALLALTETAAGRFELIVVDNASLDETPVRLGQLRGANVIFNETNRGFGPANNQGAELARAPYLLLLNSDAFVRPGWLEPLLEAIRHESVGAAVPRCLHPDGSLQDAGALLARDGTVAIYGDGEDPGRLQFRFRRVLDYGSAVCMLVRRSAFEAISGFDEAFVPAYYEDVDLCMRLAAGGFCTLYEPRSTVTHIRYGSGGDEDAVVLSERNRTVFLDRWRSRLDGRPLTLSRPTQRAVLGARDALATPRVLICASASDDAAGRWADAILMSWPRARVTWVIDRSPGDHADADRWLNKGVELLDPAEEPCWAENRLLHYDLVGIDEDLASGAREVLAKSQPQARFVLLSTLCPDNGRLPSSMVSDLAASGIAPPDS